MIIYRIGDLKWEHSTPKQVIFKIILNVTAQISCYSPKNWKTFLNPY